MCVRGSRISKADSSFHLTDRGVVASDLLLDLRLVLFEVGKTLLQVQVLLSLVRNGLVIDLTHVLEAGNQVSHVVRVKGVQLVPHRFDLHTVGFNLAFVVLKLLLSFSKHRAKVLNVETHCVGIGTG